MPEITPFLKSLLSVAGLSGYEAPAARLIEEKWRPLVDELTVSRLGSLHGLKKGSLPVALPESGKRPSIMIATHMDAIGLMVSQLVGEFLHITQVGGIDPRILPGTPVIVHATGGGSTDELYGVVVQPHVRALPANVGDGPVPLKDLLIDVGLSAKELAAKVNIGDLASFVTEPTELSGGVISGHTLDNRASVAALTIALEELKGKAHAWDVWAVATAQEETVLGGAYTSAFDLRPDLAVAVDVTFAKGPGASDWSTFPLGKGPTLAYGPNIHTYLFNKFKELADKLEIPYALEMVSRHSGTDTYAMQVTAEGIPTMVIGIPLRYMHTPVEMVALKDIQRTGRLLAEFIAALDVDFLDKITWDE
ncbi:MAG: M20/M25/M40 family metallo-hydrolase [Chloroflexi bacterium]|nr:M20/M25/M40 family metallo-hydrolase [Chloroflexota bacterium]